MIYQAEIKKVPMKRRKEDVGSWALGADLVGMGLGFMDSSSRRFAANGAFLGLGIC